jgi:hypothetical protein
MGKDLARGAAVSCLACSGVFAAIALLAAVPFAYGQTPPGLANNPFIDQSDTGKQVRVLPLPARVRMPGDPNPLFAAPRNGTQVYPPSYGCSTLLNHGGPEISNAAFQAIYWNSNVDTTIQGHIANFITAFPDNQNWDNSATDDFTIIQQYGYGTTPIANSLLNFPAFVDSQAAVSQISDSQIQSYLASLFSGGRLTPTAFTIYGVFFPSGTRVVFSANSASCTSFCAYHSVFTYGGYQIKYAVFPYPNCVGCQLSGTSVADMLTIFASHEIREAVTDPGDNSTNAWYDACGYEADDKCAWSNLYRTTNGNFLVQPEYSNGLTITLPGSSTATTFPGPGCVVPNQGTSTPVTVSSLALDPSSVAGGNSSTGTVTLSGAAPSGGAGVSLKSSSSAASVPSSVTVPASQTSATFTVTTSTVAASTNATITATYNGSSKSATLTVTPPSSTGDFSVSLSPSSRTIRRGQNAQYTVTVASSGGFTGTVSFSASGLPSRSSVSFSPTSVSGSGTATMTVQTSNKTPTGTYSSVTVQGNSGSLAHTSNGVTLVVTH